jgi:hypothetical protein
MALHLNNSAKYGDTDNQLLQKIADSVAVFSGTSGDPPATAAKQDAALTQLQSNQNTGGYTSLIELAPTVTAELYAANDSVGGKLTLTDALRAGSKTGILESISLLDRSNSKAALTVVIFSADPAAATITDGAAFVASTDDTKIQAMVSVTAADWVTINGEAYATLKGLGTVVKGTASTLYAAVICVGTPTFAATTNFAIKFGFLQDF